MNGPNQLDFSVIIPTFRRPKELVEAVVSAGKQTETTVEIFVIDDSPEGSAQQVVEGLRDARVSYLRNPFPSGGAPSVVRNLGWPHAKGKFVHFLDDDDIVPAGYYAAVKEAFSAHPDVGLVFGRVEAFGAAQDAQLQNERRYFENARRNALICRRFGLKWGFVSRMLFGDALLISSASVSRRECVEQLGGFDAGIRLMEDTDYHVRAIREFGAHYMDEIAIQYRISNPSLLHSPNPSPEQIKRQREGHRAMQAKYRQRRGLLEFYALALLSRTVLKLL